MVNIYRLTTEGTIEEKILLSAKRKLVLDHLIIQTMDKKGKNKANDIFDKDELQKILQFGVEDIVLVDKAGALCPGEEWMNPAQKAMAEITNKNKQRGPLSEVIKGKDIFIGVSAPNVVTPEMVSTMANDAIVFAMANPTPEIMPDLAKQGGARVVATGRSDFPNQINNVLVFPGIFRGALDVRATEITEEMKLAASRAIASLVTEEELNEEYIIPSPFDKRVAPVVAKEVGRVAREQGVARA